jgi:O-methyltransferase
VLETGLEPAAELYVDLLKKCLTRSVFDTGVRNLSPKYGTPAWVFYTPFSRLLARAGLALVRRASPDVRADGRDWPFEGETMIGLRRLDSLQHCVLDVLQRNIKGDLIETGVWRGGAAIFMRSLLKVYGDTKRTVWAADSFQGLPQARPNSPDNGDPHWAYAELAVSLDEVKANFAKYGALDDQVRFLVGWFRDTLPYAPIDALSIVRLDGDMYDSTMDALEALYPKLSIGGYLIVDDFGLPGCRAAVEEYRTRYHITEPIEPIDWTSILWKRTQ